jgi:prophage regulatory protein
VFERAKTQANATCRTSAMNAQPAPSDALPRLLRLQQVGEITGLRRSMIYQLEAEGNFPRRVKLATRAVGWVESEIRAWISARIMIRDDLNQRAQLQQLAVPRTADKQAASGTLRGEKLGNENKVAGW